MPGGSGKRRPRDRAVVARALRHHGRVPHPDQPGTLDPLDEAILRELARDARATFAEIGAAVSLSAPAVKRRVDRLRDRGVIRGYTVRLDPEALGWSTEAFVELYCQGSTSPATMRAAVERYPEVTAASTVTGDVDVVLQVRARDMRHLERVVERLAAEPFVARTRSTIVLSALVRRPEVPQQA